MVSKGSIQRSYTPSWSRVFLTGSSRTKDKTIVENPNKAIVEKSSLGNSLVLLLRSCGADPPRQ